MPRNVWGVHVCLCVKGLIIISTVVYIVCVLSVFAFVCAVASSIVDIALYECILCIEVCVCAWVVSGGVVLFWHVCGCLSALAVFASASLRLREPCL